MIAFGINIMIGRFLKKYNYRLIETSKYGVGLKGLSIRIIIEDIEPQDSYLKGLAKRVISRLGKFNQYTIWIYYPGDDTNQKARIMVEINSKNKITIDRLN